MPTLVPPQCTLLADVDGIFADFDTWYYTTAERIAISHEKPFAISGRPAWDCGERLESWLRDLTEQQIREHHGARDIPPFKENVKAFIALCEKYKRSLNVFFVTSHMNRCPTWVYDRDEWLQLYFGAELGSNVIHTKHKYKVVGDVFVDDKVSNVYEWSQWHPDKYGLVWNRPHNEAQSPIDYTGSLLRVSKIEQLITYIDLVLEKKRNDQFRSSR